MAFAWNVRYFSHFCSSLPFRFWFSIYIGYRALQLLVMFKLNNLLMFHQQKLFIWLWHSIESQDMWWVEMSSAISAISAIVRVYYAGLAVWGERSRARASTRALNYQGARFDTRLVYFLCLKSRAWRINWSNKQSQSCQTIASSAVNYVNIHVIFMSYNSSG